MSNIDVLCIGIACIDTIVTGFSKEKFLIENETHRVRSIKRNIGGDAANQAINLKKLNNEVEIICAVGDDSTGEEIINFLENNKVSTDSVLKYSNCDSSQAIVLVDDDGERKFISPRTNHSIPYKIKKEMLKKAKIVSIASIGSMPFKDIDQILIVVKEAKKNNSIVCTDVLCTGWLKNIKQIEEALPYIDYIFPNYDEASLITGEKELNKIADVFLEKGVHNVIIKCGKEGCYFKNSGKESFFNSVPEISAKDTTGAGDSFVAGFITGLVKNLNESESCIMANSIAAYNVQHIGATVESYDFNVIDNYTKKIKEKRK